MQGADHDTFRAEHPALVGTSSFSRDADGVLQMHSIIIDRILQTGFIDAFLTPVRETRVADAISHHRYVLQAKVIDAILTSVRETADLLRQGDSSGQIGSSNTFGDQQLQVAPISATSKL